VAIFVVNHSLYCKIKTSTLLFIFL